MGVPTDTIADFLTQIRNASRAGKENITVPGSKMSLKIAEILKQEGFVSNFKLVEEGVKKRIRIHLKYMQGKKPVIRSLNRISTPGLRHYVGSEEIPRVLGGLGISILSTPKGLMTDREARMKKLGGELLCEVW